MNDIKLLMKAVEKACSCSTAHIRTDNVTEKYRNVVVWDGMVEIFELHGHPKAKFCYAWEDQTKGCQGFVTVLGIRPVDSAQKAVQAYIVGVGKKTS
jgi:hypothetical protein